ncbi:glycine-rich cell wall structural protein 1-like [Homarus americanus]|uniref:glycine-rich cell wall structural protein 1-like n=1 Tax=Homarus americanus TaxID=6706 RepID=UPI001C48A894|nr:glycine-rich cell wall structural protein 1-like [Homarus americanus]
MQKVQGVPLSGSGSPGSDTGGVGVGGSFGSQPASGAEGPGFGAGSDFGFGGGVGVPLPGSGSPGSDTGGVGVGGSLGSQPASGAEGPGFGAGSDFGFGGGVGVPLSGSGSPGSDTGGVGVGGSLGSQPAFGAESPGFGAGSDFGFGGGVGVPLPGSGAGSPGFGIGTEGPEFGGGAASSGIGPGSDSGFGAGVGVSLPGFGGGASGTGGFGDDVNTLGTESGTGSPGIPLTGFGGTDPLGTHSGVGSQGFGDVGVSLPGSGGGGVDPLRTDFGGGFTNGPGGFGFNFGGLGVTSAPDSGFSAGGAGVPLPDFGSGPESHAGGSIGLQGIGDNNASGSGLFSESVGVSLPSFNGGSEFGFNAGTLDASDVPLQGPPFPSDISIGPNFGSDSPPAFSPGNEVGGSLSSGGGLNIKGSTAGVGVPLNTESGKKKGTGLTFINPATSVFPFFELGPPELSPGKAAGGRKTPFDSPHVTEGSPSVKQGFSNAAKNDITVEDSGLVEPVHRAEDSTVTEPQDLEQVYHEIYGIKLLANDPRKQTPAPKNLELPRL